MEYKKSVPPVLLERICDAERSKMSAEEIVNKGAELGQTHGEMFMLEHPYFPGCGIRFQWYFGSGCQCPECGRLYQVLMEDLKAGKYAVTS